MDPTAPTDRGVLRLAAGVAGTGAVQYRPGVFVVAGALDMCHVGGCPDVAAVSLPPFAGIGRFRAFLATDPPARLPPPLLGLPPFLASVGLGEREAVAAWRYKTVVDTLVCNGTREAFEVAAEAGWTLDALVRDPVFPAMRHDEVAFALLRSALSAAGLQAGCRRGAGAGGAPCACQWSVAHFAEWLEGGQHAVAASVAPAECKGHVLAAVRLDRVQPVAMRLRLEHDLSAPGFDPAALARSFPPDTVAAIAQYALSSRSQALRRTGRSLVALVAPACGAAAARRLMSMALELGDLRTAWMVFDGPAAPEEGCPPPPPGALGSALELMTRVRSLERIVAALLIERAL